MIKILFRNCTYVHTFKSCKQIITNSTVNVQSKYPYVFQIYSPTQVKEWKVTCSCQ